MSLFDTPSWAHQSAHSVQQCCRYLSHPNHCRTDWERESLSMQHMSLSSQRVKCCNGRPLHTQHTKTSMIRSFMMGHQWGMSSNMLRTVGSQGTSIQHGATRIKIWRDLWHVPLEMWTTLEEPTLEEEIHNSTATVMDGWMHSSPKFLKESTAPQFKKTDVD